MNLFRGCLTGLVLAVALVLSVFASLSPASAQSAPSPVAQSIIVEGATRGDADTIKSYFSGIDQASVNRAIADLSATGMYSKVSAKIVDGKVVVSVVEGGLVINRVAFEGNSKLKSDQLAVEIQSKGHTAFNEATAKSDVEKLKEAYKKIGRDATKITYRLVNLPNGRVDLVFTIDEGDKTGVRDDQLRRQQRDFVLSPAQPDADDDDELPFLVQDQRRLQSRHAGLGRGDDSQILHAIRLRRLPDREHRRRLQAGGSRLRHHDHRRRGSALSRFRRRR